MARMTQQQKEIKAQDDRINRIYIATCKNVQIPMMQIPEIFKKGRAAIQAGNCSDEDLAKVITDYVTTIRTN